MCIIIIWIAFLLFTMHYLLQTKKKYKLCLLIFCQSILEAYAVLQTTMLTYEESQQNRDSILSCVFCFQ